MILHSKPKLDNDSLKRIIGVDPGYDRLGICILEKNKNVEKLIFSACLVTNKKDSFSERITDLGEKFKEILNEYKPNEIAIEKIFITNNQKTAIAVAEIRGVLIYLSHLKNIKFFEYSPPEIKLAVTGYGKATKKDIEIMVPKILKIDNIKDKSDDEIDAIAIALTHSAKKIF